MARRKPREEGSGSKKEVKRRQKELKKERKHAEKQAKRLRKLGHEVTADELLRLQHGEPEPRRRPPQERPIDVDRSACKTAAI